MDDKIDMVYLWCDGSNPEFMKRKQKYCSIQDNPDNESTGDVRFSDNQELKYSLRSLERNAPWIDHVYIVTDRQVPDWLDTNNTRVTVVDHAQIMPQEYIPCFNSVVIERYLGFIPNLREHFLYGNDETFFGKPVNKNFFFHEGKPIVRVYSNKSLYADIYLDDFEANGNLRTWDKSLINTWKFFTKVNQLNECYFYCMHHNVDAYNKSDFISTYFKYKKYLDKNVFRFRNAKDIERIIFGMDAVLNHKSELKVLQRESKFERYTFWLRNLELDSHYATKRFKSLVALDCLHPKLYCINDEVGVNKYWGKKIFTYFMKRHFPEPSSFEK